ncbi:hypothetical protein TWF679_009703 [Orbilia oligospora]|uniref:Uncharacterized protein n=1 Tax=Orbilia oligospora TaxID=2813651 RepID=A0A8H8VJG9_ORBOL|nr:hypothetical protein TWF679_009703 [Orbilia oligospora]
MSSFNIGALRVVLLETPGITNSYIPSVLPEVEEFLAKSFPGKKQRTAESAVYEIVEWALGRISNITLQSFESDKEGRPKDPSPKGDVDFPQVSCLVPSIGAGDKPTIGSGIVKWQAEPELGAKALMKAVECNYPQTTKLLLEAGTNPKTFTMNKFRLQCVDWQNHLEDSAILSIAPKISFKDLSR